MLRDNLSHLKRIEICYTYMSVTIYFGEGASIKN